MDVAQTFDALRASARSGQVFPHWWCLSDTAGQEQARAYCRAYQPFFRHDTWGSTLTCQVLRFTLPPPSSPNVTEASCNAIGHSLLAQLGPWGAPTRTGIADKEHRLPYYLDMLAVELLVLDGGEALYQMGKTEPRLRQREARWLHQLFNRPAYQRPEPLARTAGTKQGLSIPVMILGDSTLGQLLIEFFGVVGPSDQTPILRPKQVEVYGSPAESETLTVQDLNQVRAYLRLPRLDEGTIQLQHYSSDNAKNPVFGIAEWHGRPVFFSHIEVSVDESGQAVSPVRYILLEATPVQIEESIRQQHQYPMALGIKQNRVIGWFERQEPARL